VTELHERDEQVEAIQAQAINLLHEVEHLQELTLRSLRRTPRRLRACPVWRTTRVSML
jgi:hypothetical protein